MTAGKWMPAEPTEEMKAAGYQGSRDVADIYRAMYAVAPAPGPDSPVAYLHEIEEPDRSPECVMSFSPDNPWSHWVQAHRDRCTYTVTPLYAAPPGSEAPVTDEVRKVLEPFVAEFIRSTNPGDSDLDNEQPYHLVVPLGACRAARALLARWG